MQIKEAIERGTAQLTFIGDLLWEVDGAAVRSTISTIAAKDVKHVVIDFDGVHHINSAGLGSLVAALTTMRRSGGDIRLARVCPHVHNIFAVTRLVGIFETYDTVEEALKASRDPGALKTLK